MNVKEYNIKKTAKRTATENNLIFVDGNMMTEHKLLFDFSFLDSLDIPENEKEAIREESTKHCSITNNTAYIIKTLDKFTLCNAVIDFNYHKVYNSKTWKLMYIIMEVKHVKYFHGERTTVYDDYYNENIKQFDVCSNTVQPKNDIEI